MCFQLEVMLRTMQHGSWALVAGGRLGKGTGTAGVWDQAKAARGFITWLRLRPGGWGQWCGAVCGAEWTHSPGDEEEASCRLSAEQAALPLNC